MIQVIRTSVAPWIFARAHVVVPQGVDTITLQACGFSMFAPITAVTMLDGASGFDINIGNGSHVVVPGVVDTSMHAADFGLSS